MDSVSYKNLLSKYVINHTYYVWENVYILSLYMHIHTLSLSFALYIYTHTGKCVKLNAKKTAIHIHTNFCNIHS